MKTKIIISVAVLAAFLWGYRGKVLLAALDERLNGSKEEGGETVEAAAPAQPAPRSPLEAARSSAPNLKETMQAITPQGRNDEVEARRSQYLENLSNRMKELGGEAPPPPPPAVPGRPDPAAPSPLAVPQVVDQPPIIPQAVPAEESAAAEEETDEEEITEDDEEVAEDEEIGEGDEDEVIDDEGADLEEEPVEEP